VNEAQTNQRMMAGASRACNKQSYIGGYHVKRALRERAFGVSLSHSFQKSLAFWELRTQVLSALDPRNVQAEACSKRPPG
jgi:hypothetical protein